MTFFERIGEHRIERIVAHPDGSATLPKQTLRLIFYSELFILDLICFLSGFVFARLVQAHFGLATKGAYVPLAVAVVYALVALARGGYSLKVISNGIAAVRAGVYAYSIAVLIVLMVAFFLKGGADISRVNFGLSIAGAGVCLIIARGLFPRHVRKAAGRRLIDELLMVHGKPLGTAQLGVITVNADNIGLRPDLQDPEMLNRFGTLVKAYDRVLIDCLPEHRRAWSLMLKGANVNGEIFVQQANEVGAIGINKFEGRDTLLVARQPLSLSNRLQKRALDLAICTPLIIALAPLLALVALAIKLETPGPVFFRQQRVGRGNELFRVLKFRSMRVAGCDAAGTRSTSRDDDRITRVGRFIRSTSIDELPQLFNVLLGDMSLVGPRPHALGSLAEQKLFWQIDETYWLRHQLKPGITGLAQVRGFRGSTVLASDLLNRLQADMEYIQGWNIWRDISILMNTTRVIVHKNAY